jgi:hypothetical protein
LLRALHENVHDDHERVHDDDREHDHGGYRAHVHDDHERDRDRENKLDKKLKIELYQEARVPSFFWPFLYLKIISIKSF